MTGVELIAAERQRQIDVEGYDAAHDRSHAAALAMAGATYATPEKHRRLPIPARGRIPELWPWNADYYKPTPEDRVRELVKAGALIAAAIDSHLASQPPSTPREP